MFKFLLIIIYIVIFSMIWSTGPVSHSNRQNYRQQWSIFDYTQPVNLQKKQCGGVYFWPYGIAYWMPIQQKLTPPVLLFCDFAGMFTFFFFHIFERFYLSFFYFPALVWYVRIPFARRLFSVREASLSSKRTIPSGPPTTQHFLLQSKNQWG